MAYVVYLELRNKRGDVKIVPYHPDMPPVEGYTRYAAGVYAVVDGGYVLISSVRSTCLSRQFIAKFVDECVAMRRAAAALVALSAEVVLIE